MAEENINQQETIDWDTGIKGVKPVKLIEMKDPMEKAPVGFPIPIMVSAAGEIQENLQREVIRVLSESSSAKEIAAANFLAKQLGGTVSQADCIAAVKKIRRLRTIHTGSRTSRGGRNAKDTKVVVDLRQAYWVGEKDFESLRNVPGVYRIDDPGSSRQSIESTIEWPKSVSKQDPDIDNWMKQVGGSGLNAEQAAGKMVSMGSRPASQTPAPSRPKIQRGK